MPIYGAAAAALGGKLRNVFSRYVPPARYRTPAQLHRTRVGAFEKAAAAIREGKRAPLEFDQGTHRETHEPLDALMLWAEYSAKAETRAAAAQILERLASDGHIRATGRGASVKDRQGTSRSIATGYAYAAMTKRGAPKAAGKRDTGEKRAKSARAARGRRRTRKPRTYVRYDPDTGERVQVTQDDPRYDEWTNRRPRAARTTRGRSTARRRATRGMSSRDVERLAEAALTAGVPIGQAAARKFASMAAAAGLSVSVAATLVVATGLAAYFATTWLIENSRPDVRESKLALAYRKARERFEREHYGRVGSPPGTLMTRTEHDLLAERFKDSLKRRRAGVTFKGGAL